ncbi:sortase [Helicobacter pylori]|nr:sortase [Helicobacter pylori]
MPLPFILGGLALAAAGYGFKKSIDASETADKVNEIVKEAEDLKEGAKNRVELVQSGYKNALMGLGEKKLHVISRGVSRFVEHFNQLKGHQFFVKDSDMQDLHKQVSVAQNFSKQLNASGMSEESAIGGMFAGFGSLGISSFITGAMLGGELTMGGLAGMAVFGGLVAGPALAILGAMSADKMEEKLEKAKAYHSQVEKAVKKADAIIDQFQAIEKMDKLFTRQITKCDALLFLLSQDAIATMKKHNYDTSLYSQEERDRLCVAVSTLMTLSAFLKVPIIDKDQKLQEKAQRALEIMKGQMDSLESGRYDVKMIQSRQQDLENLFKKGSPRGLKDKGL